jgi:hypothetical protein
MVLVTGRRQHSLFSDTGLRHRTFLRVRESASEGFLTQIAACQLNAQHNLRSFLIMMSEHCL